jgi:hypothetical protein
MIALNVLFVNVYVWLLWIQQQGPGQGITFVDLNKGDPQPSFFAYILITFRFIGYAVLVAAAIGAVGGLIRIWIRLRFPGNRLNGVDVEILTFLHLNEHSEPDR